MSPSSALVVGLLVLTACGLSTSESDTTTPAEAALSSSTIAGAAATSVPAPTPDGDNAFVVHVDDGDSLIVEMDGDEHRVRLIGINAPERGECLGDASRMALAALIDQRSVVLVADAEDRDDFDRLLRYVYIDGLFVNESQVGTGMAIARAFQPNTTEQPRLERAQEMAQMEAIGLWAADACGEADQEVAIGVLAIQSDPSGPDEDNLNGEFVIFENVGDSTIDLSGYTLRDGSSRNRYELPDGFTVPGGGRFVVYVGCGTDTEAELFWCSDGPVWSNDGDEVFLTDAAGNIVAYESY